MPAYCTPCGRPFKVQADLDQHIRTSSAHKKSTPTAPLQARTTGQIKQLPPVKPSVSSIPQPKRQEQRYGSPFSVVTHQVSRSPRAPQAPDQGKHAQPPEAIASSSRPHHGTNSALTTVYQDEKSPWSVIPESEYAAVLEAVSVRCHSPMELQDNNYLTRPYHALDYVNLRKCKQCNSQEKHARDRECTFHPKKRNKWNPNRPYKCCRTEGRGCMTLPTHDFQLPLRAIKHKDFLPTPAASAHETKFGAVTLDCEMAGVAGGAGEAILLCVTEYVTGAVLLNQFVAPRETITQMRSSIHGISKSTLNAAIAQGQALAGWEGARRELWKYIDADTVLIGHSLEHDLDALRIIHPRIVDSGILSRDAVGIRRIRWGLKTLCSELLHSEIRKNKGGIHDCLEDVFATREVVLFCTRNNEEFQSWARAKRIEELAKQAKKDKEVKKDT